MAKRPILGLFEDANYAAEAGDALQEAGVAPTDYDFLTDAPYPEGAFGERHEGHSLYIFPLCGALVGLTIGILLTSMTQMAYPLVQAGKPILSLPPMAVVTYESTMLTAIIFTIIGIVFESRLPNLKQGLYDTRITEGYIGVLANVEEEQLTQVSTLFTQAGAIAIRTEDDVVRENQPPPSSRRAAREGGGNLSPPPQGESYRQSPPPEGESYRQSPPPQGEG